MLTSEMLSASEDSLLYKGVVCYKLLNRNELVTLAPIRQLGKKIYNIFGEKQIS